MGGEKKDGCDTLCRLDQVHGVLELISSSLLKKGVVLSGPLLHLTSYGSVILRRCDSPALGVGGADFSKVIRPCPVLHFHLNASLLSSNQ